MCCIIPLIGHVWNSQIHRDRQRLVVTCGGQGTWGSGGSGVRLLVSAGVLLQSAAEPALTGVARSAGAVHKAKGHWFDSWAGRVPGLWK